MADRIISAEVRINGQDAGVAEMLAKVAASIKRVDEVAGQSGQMQQLGRQMVELKGQMEAVGRLKTVETNLGAMQTRAAEAATKVEKLKTEMAGVAAPTAAMARTMEAAEVASAKAAAAVVRQTEAFERNRKAVADMGLSTANAVREQERLARSFQDTARAAEVTMRAEQRAESAAAHLAKSSHGAAHGHGSGLDIGGVVAGVLAGHSILHGAEMVGEVYRHFDKERRYGAVVMNLTPEQQAPLVEQAIHGGATSKFNDIQWLESQRELAMRGYNKDQVLGFTPIVAQLGQAFDVSMPEAVKALEGAMLGFGKDVSTFEKASAAATRTADLEVKASKISGMGFEDIVALYKYAAAPAKMAHLSEESMLAYGAISKKSNMGGDEAGVAFRALAKNLISPTAGAQVAMQAAGIDFSKFQHAPDHLDTGGFVATIAKEFGIRLDAQTRGKLDKLFHDKAVIGDAARFMPAVQELLGDSLGGDDAKSKNKIAQKARAYRDASMQSVDTNGLMAAIMEGISKSPQLANAIFGSKQGGRIFAALGDPKFFHHILDELHNESGGFASKVSEERMAGFDGAASKFEGAVKNFETAIGRAFDDGGKGGFLTAATEGAAHFVQTLAEADPHLLQIGAAAAGLTGLWGSAKLVGLFSGGFGLKGSAGLLDKAALHLMEVGVGPGGRANPLAKVPPVAPLGGVPELAIPGGVTLGAGALFLGGAAIATEIVKKSLEAQQAGHHGLWAAATLATEREDRQDVAELQAERAEVAKRIADQKAREKLPGTADVATSADRARLDQLDAAIDNKIRSLDALHPNAQPRTAPLPVARPAQPPAFHPDDHPDRAEPYVRPETPMNREQTFRFMQGLGMLPSGWQMEQQGPSRPAAPFAPFAMIPADRADRTRERDDAIRVFQQELLDAAPVMGQLDRQTGLVLTSFDGLNGGAGTLGTSFGTLGTGVGGAAHELDVLGLAARTTATALASLLQAAAAGGGNGIINASFGGGGMSGGGWNGNPLAVAGGFGSAGWTKSGATRPEVAAYIKAQAARLGIDPNVALRVAQSEGLNTYVGDYGTSFGAFQLHYGASGIRGMNSGGLGDRFTRQTGQSARDPTTWKAQVDFALKTAKREGWGAWHGAAHVGIGSRQGLDWHGKVPQEHPALAAPPLPHRGRAAPHSDGPETTAHNELVGAVRKMTAAVERGGLHRIHVALDKGLTGRKVYQRGSVGATVA